ncbi:hypothetical protein [Paenibacillus sp. KN14-4R]|uniref:hypothetical protein n=1 Tax=Paenibacillus sp. KN14-4R TaxID=3445773 RepID=UPI003F9F2E86
MEIAIDDINHEENKGKIIVELSAEECLEISIIQTFQYGMRAKIKLSRDHVDSLLVSLNIGLNRMNQGISSLEREGVRIINVDSNSRENTGKIIVSLIPSYLILSISLTYFGDPELFLNMEQVGLLINIIKDLM